MAQKGGFAVPAFNVYNMETVIGAIEAAEEAKAPIIMQLYPRLVKEGVAYYLAPSIIAAAKKASVPVCFHLDHGPSELEVTRALYWGATGIMLDGSVHSFEENVAMTKKAVETCSYVGIGVEGELGHIGSVNDDTMCEFTDVDEVIGTHLLLRLNVVRRPPQPSYSAPEQSQSDFRNRLDIGKPR